MRFPANPCSSSNTGLVFVCLKNRFKKGEQNKMSLYISSVSTTNKLRVCPKVFLTVEKIRAEKD